MSFKNLKRILEPLWAGNGAIPAGRTCFRKIYLKPEDRKIHSINLGASGSGKSRLALHLAAHGINRGEGIGVIDPAGDLYGRLVKAVYDRYRRSKVKGTGEYILVDPTGERVPGFNPLEVPRGEDPHPYCLDLMGVFEALWPKFWGPRMADILRNTLLALMEHGLTLLEVPRFLTDPDFRGILAGELTNHRVKEFWQYRFEPLPEREKRTWIESTLNKVSEFISSPAVAEIVGQKRSTIDFREVLDRGKILLINLSKGQLKPQNAHLLGAFLVAKLNQEAMGRVKLPPEKRKTYHLYVDEFQNYASASFREILSESRKAGLSLHMITQDFAGIEDDLQASILANAKLIFCFRTSREDGEIMAKHLFQATGEKVKFQLRRDWWGEPESNPIFRSINEEREHRINELVNLKCRQVYLKVRGRRGAPMLIRTITTPQYRFGQKEINRFKGRVTASYTKSRRAVRMALRRRRRRLDQRVEEAVLDEDL